MNITFCTSEQALEIARQAAFEAVKEVMRQQPRPIHVNQRTAAEMLRVSQTTIGKMIREGKLTKNECNRIPVAQIDKLLGA